MKISQRIFGAIPDQPKDNGGIVLVIDPSQGAHAEHAATELDPRVDLINHSPDGFGWGYSGSGPAQLALALLAEVAQDDDIAIDLHQPFKHDVIARQPLGAWSISEEYIRGWIEAILARPLYRDTPPNIVDQDEDIKPSPTCWPRSSSIRSWSSSCRKWGIQI